MRYFFSHRKDNFIEKYDYGRGIVNLNEYVVRTVSSCPMKCIYCYLQDIYQNENIILYNNFEKLEKELSDLYKSVKGTIYLNNGENADSLFFEPEFGMNKFLIEKLRKFNSMYLELRTKTANVNHLLELEHKNNVIITFSLNPQDYIAKYEINTSSLAERLKAIKKCQEAKYLIGLRFEPILHLNNWKKEYQELVKTISGQIDIHNIHSIGISALRLTKGLFKKIEKKHGTIELLIDEFIPAPDNKLKYFKKIRIDIYQTFIGILNRYFDNLILSKDFFLSVNTAKTPVFISSEPDYIWDYLLQPSSIKTQ